MMTPLTGVWVAMPTPWAGDGRIDAGVVRELVGRYAAAEVFPAMPLAVREPYLPGGTEDVETLRRLTNAEFPKVHG